MWQRRFLLITGVIELLLMVPVLVFAVLLGYHGFAAGEMGEMIGIFSVVIVLFLLPYFAARLTAVLGLRKEKRWAAVLCLLLSILVLLAALFSFLEIPVLFILLVFYTGLSIHAAAGCLRH